ncbi:MAG: ATP-binding cassette domain-containing protein [Firmicutes bacterium]|nr:ATP-binding cassette domain-containing protein [Bacillota bacterium]
MFTLSQGLSFRFQFYGNEVDKSIQVLSGGERVRLYLSCVMLENADCLILDEPANHLELLDRDIFRLLTKPGLFKPGFNHA